MDILVGFEESQEVTAAFIAQGHNAMSCDLYHDGAKGLPHYRGDIFDVLCQRWDLVILHPPCTFTALCGNRWYWNSPLRPEGIELCTRAWDTARKYSNHVLLEQPKTIMQKYIGKRSQVIQPWMFGHPESKETWLWAWGLGPLTETDNVYEEMMRLPKTKRTRIHYMSPGPDRQRKRSETFPGIAKAFAEQLPKYLGA
jgi:hypothetical protein